VLIRIIRIFKGDHVISLKVFSSSVHALQGENYLEGDEMAKVSVSVEHNWEKAGAYQNDQE
jgi:hypothetical protein